MLRKQYNSLGVNINIARNSLGFLSNHVVGEGGGLPGGFFNERPATPAKDNCVDSKTPLLSLVVIYGSVGEVSRDWKIILTTASCE